MGTKFGQPSFLAIVAASTQVTTGASSLDVPIPLTAAGVRAEAVRLSSKGNAYIRPGLATAATGTITIAGGVPTAADTVTVNGVAIEFVASGATGDQVNIGGTAALTATALYNFLAASSDADLIVASYADNGAGVITITHNTLGILGEAFTLTESADNLAVSDTTLTGSTSPTAAAASAILLVAGQELLLNVSGMTNIAYLQETSASVVNISPIECG